MRTPLRLVLTVVLTCAAAAFVVALATRAGAGGERVPTRHNEATIARLQEEMASGRTTSEALTREYLERIAALDQADPGVNAVIELNPEALDLARHADELRRQGRVLGPLHGIPVLLKDNIDTGDAMQTTAGSLGLRGAPAGRDATVVAKLRAAGAVILGKTNLSEWANFRSVASTSGWSAVGGQTGNPYALNRSPCGSSSGSAAAVSANFTVIALATETDGSIVCPAHANGVVGIKPTVGLTSRGGVVPISRTQDSVGVHARTVADAAAALGVIQSLQPDLRDPATAGVPLGWRGRLSRPLIIPSEYTRFLDAKGLAGARLGLTRQGFDRAPPPVAAAFEGAIARIRAAGATVIDLDAAGFEFPPPDGELLVMLFEFRDDLPRYLASRTGVPLAGRGLAQAIAFNRQHAAAEMPLFQQELFEAAIALARGEDDPQPAFDNLTYTEALEIDRSASVEGVDKAIAEFALDAVIAPSGNPAWAIDSVYGDRFLFGSSRLAGAPGYPIVEVPAATVSGLPIGISFIGHRLQRAPAHQAGIGLRSRQPHPCEQPARLRARGARPRSPRSRRADTARPGWLRSRAEAGRRLAAEIYVTAVPDPFPWPRLAVQARGTDARSA